MISFPRSLPGLVALILRILLGALFVYSGFVKAQDPAAFLTNIRSFHILDDPYAAWLAMGLPWLEILAGAAILSGICVEGGLTVIFGMLSVFLWAIIYSWHRGLDIDCGCFGKDAQDASYAERIAQDLAFLAVAGGLLIHRIIRKR